MCRRTAPRSSRPAERTRPRGLWSVLVWLLLVLLVLVVVVLGVVVVVVVVVVVISVVLWLSIIIVITIMIMAIISLVLVPAHAARHMDSVLDAQNDAIDRMFGFGALTYVYDKCLRKPYI